MSDDPREPPTGDHLQRVLLEAANARCVVVHLDRVLAEVLARGPYPPAVAGLLGEALVVTALCSSGLKFEGRISLQLRSGSALSLLMADCTDDGGLRGLARFDAKALAAGSAGSVDLRRLAAGGTLTMTLEPSDRGQTYQGIVPLLGSGMAEAMEAYFRQSEQLETRIRVIVRDGAAAGILLQKLPGEAPDPDGWNRLGRLLDTVSVDELQATDSATLLHRLFHEEPRRLFPARPLAFHCPCSRERVMAVLRSLGEAELTDILESRGEVDVDCQFCNENYAFDRLDLEQLIRNDAPEVPDGGSIH
ncbi:Hsp33 family molecular chaperone HslO [Wenzhouxiangella sp. XN79A]|uniref:Hsp33 family molecular chaperone HslO n=1 Tax=Wenzhouxiangella sp. XN79A TaxID=2724193 RepID=UPI00144AA16B|nr:Hsp33 family molecular chaperone HslO [Wenzhouxiangella sp. XN79A]NKI36021.1 Hsp33 family molecular chaperone HslO [Wenzhouxiangella sp. XN79A]